MSEITVIEIVDDNAPLTFFELINCMPIERNFVIEMVEVGLLEPSGATADEWRFANRDLRRLRSAQRLTADLGVNSAGAAVILDLIEERDALLKRLEMLSAIVPET